MRQAMAVVGLLIGTTGCMVPGVGTVVEKSMNELRGGHGQAREITALPDGPVLDRFLKFRVLRVERSADAGPIPEALPALVESEMRDALSESGFFPGGKGPTLVIRTRLTTHWPANGLTQALNAHSEILARVEFLEAGRRTPLGVYYVRGMSNAIARKSDEQLGRGLASAVIEVIESRRTPAPDKLADRVAPPVDR
jgi:hypothetical protein